MLSTCQLIVYFIPVHRTRRQHILVSMVNHFETRREICILHQSCNPIPKEGTKAQTGINQAGRVLGALSVEGLQRTQACKSLVGFLSSPLDSFRFFFSFLSTIFFPFRLKKDCAKPACSVEEKGNEKKKNFIPCSLRAGVTLHSAVSFSF